MKNSDAFLHDSKLYIQFEEKKNPKSKKCQILLITFFGKVENHFLFTNVFFRILIVKKIRSFTTTFSAFFPIMFRVKKNRIIVKKIIFNFKKKSCGLRCLKILNKRIIFALKRIKKIIKYKESCTKKSIFNFPKNVTGFLRPIFFRDIASSTVFTQMICDAL